MSSQQPVSKSLFHGSPLCLAFVKNKQKLGTLLLVNLFFSLMQVSLCVLFFLNRGMDNFNSKPYLRDSKQCCLDTTKVECLVCSLSLSKQEVCDKFPSLNGCQETTVIATDAVDMTYESLHVLFSFVFFYRLYQNDPLTLLLLTSKRNFS